MKKIITIFLALVVLLNTFSSALLIVGYELNKSYVTEKFCVNKSKPKMHCQGKCHLQKQLKEEQKREQNPSSSTKQKIEIVNYCEPILTTKFDLYSSEKSHPFFYTEKKLLEVNTSIFHPPSCSNS